MGKGNSHQKSMKHKKACDHPQLAKVTLSEFRTLTASSATTCYDRNSDVNALRKHWSLVLDAVAIEAVGPMEDPLAVDFSQGYTGDQKLSLNFLYERTRTKA